MTDARARELERLAAQGDVDAGVRLLRERVRAGDLTDERLRLAAYLGDPAAGRLLPEEQEASFGVDASKHLESWVRGLVRWGKEPCVRAAVAASRLTLPIWKLQYPDDRIPFQLIEAAEAWLSSPCTEHAEAAESLVADHTHERTFKRGRYAYATLLAARAAGRPSTPPDPRTVADELSREEAERQRAALANAGASPRVLPSGREGRFRLVLLAVGAIGYMTTNTLGDLGYDQATLDRLAPFHGAASSYEHDAAHCARRTADALWSEEGLTVANVRAAIQREGIAWALRAG